MKWILRKWISIFWPFFPFIVQTGLNRFSVVRCSLSGKFQYYQYDWCAMEHCWGEYISYSRQRAEWFLWHSGIGRWWDPDRLK